MQTIRGRWKFIYQSSKCIWILSAKSRRLRSTKCLNMGYFHPSRKQKIWQIYLLLVRHSVSSTKWLGLLLFKTLLNSALSKAVCWGDREELHYFKGPWKLQRSPIHLCAEWIQPWDLSLVGLKRNLWPCCRRLAQSIGPCQVKQVDRIPINQAWISSHLWCMISYSPLSHSLLFMEDKSWWE